MIRSEIGCPLFWIVRSRRSPRASGRPTCRPPSLPSTRAFDAALQPLTTTQRELRQIYPAPGLVEHDPEEIWTATVSTVRDTMAQAGLAAKDIAGIGIANQRETTVV
jgi:hypothetical protein